MAHAPGWLDCKLLLGSWGTDGAGKLAEALSHDSSSGVARHSTADGISTNYFFLAGGIVGGAAGGVAAAGAAAEGCA